MSNIKRYAFISNSTKPDENTLNSREEIKPSNMSKLPINAALNLGYEVYLGVNRNNPEELTVDFDADIKLYQSNTYRSVFAFRDNYTAYKNLTNLLRSQPFDVIHCNTPVGGMVGRICGKKAKVRKIIYTAHGFHFYKGAPLLNRTVLKWAERLMARYTDAIITINQEDFEAAKKFKLRNGGKVYFMPGVGINTEEYLRVEPDRVELRKSMGLKEDDIVCIAMGDIVARKNYKTSIQAISECGSSNIHLLICGEGPEKNALEKLAAGLNVADRIHFLGFRADIKQLLKISDIFLFTTLQEGLPRSMMEAMASGLPCVASKIRGNVDLIESGKGGFLCGATDYQGFAEKLNLLAGDSELRLKMGECNLLTIKKYDIDYVKKELAAIYQKELAAD